MSVCEARLFAQGLAVWLRSRERLTSDLYGKWHHYKYIKGSGLVMAFCLNRANFPDNNLIAMPSLQKVANKSPVKELLITKWQSAASPCCYLSK